VRVSKVADIVERNIMSTVSGPTHGDLAQILTASRQVANPACDFAWSLEIIIGEGAAARVMRLRIPVLISNDDCLDGPLFVCEDKLVYFRDRLFLSERPPRTANEREEIVLRVKKAVYDEDNELTVLRAAVANLEAAVEFSKSGSRREPIPGDVKLLVWTRDGGSCVRCGSKQHLHFDHVIPVAKGGGNCAENIQILCQACNLRKGDKIAGT
jgi:hypothetical protein